MHRLSLWTVSMALAFGLASCGNTAETTGGGAGGAGGDGTTSGSNASSGNGSGSGGMTGSGGKTASSSGSLSSSGGAGGGNCMPKTTDSSEIGVDCEGTMQCSAGYTCHPFHGFITQWQCQILCAQSCECPAGMKCVATSDKMASWNQCAP